MSEPEKFVKLPDVREGSAVFWIGLLTLRIYDGDDTVYLNTAQARALREYLDKVLPNE